jgi:hypothetical protein
MSKKKFFEKKGPKTKTPPPPPVVKGSAPDEDWKEGQPFGPGSGEPAEEQDEDEQDHPSLYFDEASTEPEQVALAGLFLVGTDAGTMTGVLPHLKEVLMALPHRERRSKCQGLRHTLGRIRAALNEVEGELRGIENL